MDVLNILLGWLLGTLSPAIVDAIKSKRDAASGRAAIDNELKEFTSVLLAASFRAKCAHGTLDRPYLEWLHRRLTEIADEPSQKFLEMLTPALSVEITEAEFAAVVRALAGRDGRAILMQKYAVPLLDYRVSALQSFDTAYQIKLLQVRRNIALLDAIVDQSREFYRLTFSVQGNNHERVSGNLVQTYGEYADRSKIIADQISALRTLKKSSWFRG